jgi:hypothetical protein
MDTIILLRTDIMLSSLRGLIITRATARVLRTMRILPAQLTHQLRRGITKMCQRAIALRQLLLGGTTQAQSKTVLGCPLEIQQPLLEQVVPITTMSRTPIREIKEGMHPLGPESLH